MPTLSNRIFKPKITTDLPQEPVLLDDLKEYGAITYSDFDVLLSELLTTARLQLEDATDKSFGVKTIDLEFQHHGRPSGIGLPGGPIDEFTALTFKPCICPGADYTDILANTDGQWRLSGDRFYGLEGLYKSTYTTTGVLPETILTAIKAQAMFLYENRDDSAKQGTICPMSRTLIQSFIEGENLL